MGLPVTKEQVEELSAVVNRPGGITDDEMKAAEKYERELRHDVMAHVHALGDSCPKAKGIIHLGMTSEDVGSNADYDIIDDATDLIMAKVDRIGVALGDCAERLRAVPCLGFTHYQAAQPTTVGRRAAQWAYELHICRRRIEGTWSSDRQMRGLKGATGTQASFLSLFQGDSGRVHDLEVAMIQRLKDTGREPLRFDQWRIDYDAHLLTGQTYPRVEDCFVLADLASTASVLHKIATDIRLLSNRKELDEPFETNQIGSSAMPYKRNPMRCERICGLSRFVMNLVGNAYDTAATQWLERTLDDSSNRRLSLPEAFLALDGARPHATSPPASSSMKPWSARTSWPTPSWPPRTSSWNAETGGVPALPRTHPRPRPVRGMPSSTRPRQRPPRPPQTTRPSGLRAAAPLAELDWDGVMDPEIHGRSVEQTERFIREVVEPLREQYGQAIADLGQSGPKV